MKRLSARAPKKTRGFSWARVPTANGGVTYRLYRHDLQGALHAEVLRFPAGESRQQIQAVLRTARHKLRDSVDDIDLHFLGVTV